jgi:hypothetical protein
MTTFTLPFSPSSPEATRVVPVSGICHWQTVVQGGTLGVTGADPVNALGFIVRAGSITDVTRLIFKRSTAAGSPLGTTLRARLVYTDGPLNGEFPAVVSQLQIRVFGGPSAGTELRDGMAPLRNLNGDLSVVIRADRGVDTGLPGIYKATVPDNYAHSWDCDGCEVFLIGVERPFQTEPSVQDAYLQVKIV